MINISFTDSTLSAASTILMLPRTPVAGCCKSHRLRRHLRQHDARDRSVLPVPATHSDLAVAQIPARSSSADRQIPIAPHSN